MKKFLKWSGIGLLVLIAGLFIAGWIASEPLPEGKSGPEAEALAQKMQVATRQAAWDTTRFVRWNFAGLHRLLWDRERKLVQVEWGDSKVILNTQNHLEGIAWKGGTQLADEDAREKLNDAWSYFCNDSFWLNAPGKAFDPGTSREIVELEDGSKGLMVTYDSGGVTPGDSYLWILNEDGLPIKWKMWVSIIPIGGMESTWDNWELLSTGAKVSTSQQIGWYKSTVTELKAGNDWEDIGLQEDPFAPLLKMVSKNNK